MRNHRTHERVAEIDAFIGKHYPEHGPEYCAEKLSESKSYIQNRAWLNHVKTNKPKKRGRKPCAGEKSNWKAKYEKLQGYHKELRAEMMRIMAENKRLKQVLIVPREIA